MTAHAAQLVEAVLPRVPVRQWVLTLPYRLRYRLAWDPDNLLVGHEFMRDLEESPVPLMTHRTRAGRGDGRA